VDVPVIVDGEIIAIRHGRPDFGLLQSRMQVRHPPGHLVRQVPVQLYLFDLLHHDGQSLLRLPYTGRRERLAELDLDADPVRTPPWYPGDAADVLAVSLANGLEGVVGKPLTSAYQPGPHARGAQWVQPRLVGEVAFTEWTTDQVLRHPSWRGLRTDKDPSQVRQES
jgi:bifunctional non-homologous end joining protein LigD